MHTSSPTECFLTLRVDIMILSVQLAGSKGYPGNMFTAHGKYFTVASLFKDKNILRESTEYLQYDLNLNISEFKYRKQNLITEIDIKWFCLTPTGTRNTIYLTIKCPNKETGKYLHSILKKKKKYGEGEMFIFDNRFLH